MTTPARAPRTVVNPQVAPLVKALMQDTLLPACSDIRAIVCDQHRIVAMHLWHVREMKALALQRQT